MSVQTWVETLVSAQVDGPALSAFTTATTALPTQAIYTLPANYFYVGKVLRIRAQGRMSSFTSGTFTWSVNLGTLAAPIVVFPGSAITTVVSLTNQTYDLEILLTCRTVGSGTAATIMGIGRFTSPIVAGSTSGAQSTSWLLPATAPAVGTGFDSTITNVANLMLACSVSNASNAQTLHQYTLESMN